MVDLNGLKKSEEKADSFGILPIEIQPVGFQKWFNPFTIRIHADRIEFFSKSSSESIPFLNFRSIEEGVKNLSITHGEKEPFSTINLAGVENQSALNSLLQRLLLENRRWSQIESSQVNFSQVSSILNELFSWRGHPYVAVTDFMCKAALDFDASDFHLEPGEDQVRITFRIGRELHDVGSYPLKVHQGVISRFKYLARCQSHLSGVPQEGSWSLPVKYFADARLSVFPSLHGERCSIRIIKPIKFKRIADLGWQTDSIEAWKALLSSGPGLLVISGPVGSGKTTALYATLAELAQPGQNASLKRVLTLEDPVEGRIAGICQASLDAKSGLGLSQAFKHMLRQDPDIMALGEIRDAETLREALQAGLAGHLVITTFHAANAQGAFQRILHMGIERHLVQSGLSGILGVSLTSCHDSSQKPSTPDGQKPGHGHLQSDAQVTVLKIEHWASGDISSNIS